MKLWDCKDLVIVRNILLRKKSSDHSNTIISWDVVFKLKLAVCLCSGLSLYYYDSVWWMMHCCAVSSCVVRVSLGSSFGWSLRVFLLQQVNDSLCSSCDDEHQWFQWWAVIDLWACLEDIKRSHPRHQWSSTAARAMVSDLFKNSV